MWLVTIFRTHISVKDRKTIVNGRVIYDGKNVIPSNRLVFPLKFNRNY